MQENTVLLSVSDYNLLRDFKNKIEEGYTFFPDTGSYCGGRAYFVSNDQTVIDLVKYNENLSNQITELKSGIIKEKSIREIKQMSIWEFIKWRKK